MVKSSELRAAREGYERRLSDVNRLEADVRALRETVGELVKTLESNKRDFVAYNEAWEGINAAYPLGNSPYILITPHPFTLAVKEIDAALAKARAVTPEEKEAGL